MHILTCHYRQSSQQHQQKKIVFVGDQVPDIKAAHRTYNWVPCCARLLNTALRHTFSEGHDAPEGIKEVLEVLDNCTRLVALLKSTGVIIFLLCVGHPAEMQDRLAFPHEIQNINYFPILFVGKLSYFSGVRELQSERHFHC